MALVAPVAALVRDELAPVAGVPLLLARDWGLMFWSNTLLCTCAYFAFMPQWILSNAFLLAGRCIVDDVVPGEFNEWLERDKFVIDVDFTLDLALVASEPLLWIARFEFELLNRCDVGVGILLVVDSWLLRFALR